MDQIEISNINGDNVRSRREGKELMELMDTYKESELFGSRREREHHVVESRYFFLFYKPSCCRFAPTTCLVFRFLFRILFPILVLACKTKIASFIHSASRKRLKNGMKKKKKNRYATLCGLHTDTRKILLSRLK